MVRRSKYSKEELSRAIALIRKHKKSLGQASKETGVPRSTIKDHAWGRYVGKATHVGGVGLLTEEEERALVFYCQYMGKRALPLTRATIRRYARDIVINSGRKTRMNADEGPTHKWMRAFLKRHKKEVSLKTPRHLEKTRAELQKDDVVDYFQLLRDTLEDLNIADKPSHIFNVDETGFSGKETSKTKVVVGNDTEPHQQAVSIAGHVTVNATVCADGKVLPPMIIFKKSMPLADCTDGVPDNWVMTKSDSGYINSDLFIIWFRDVFLKNCGSRRPILLTMDNHASHLSPTVIDLAIENKIELMCFPSHSTHLLQPLDVGYFHLLKHNFTKLTTSAGYTGMRTLPRSLCPNIYKLASNKIPPCHIESAFDRAGIIPYNPDKVLSRMIVPLLHDDLEVDELPDLTANVLDEHQPSTSGTRPIDQVPVATDQATSCTSRPKRPKFVSPVLGKGKGQGKKSAKPTGTTMATPQSAAPKTDVNKLVTLGLIPANLGHILIQPPNIRSKPKRATACKKARVITKHTESQTPTPAPHATSNVPSKEKRTKIQQKPRPTKTVRRPTPKPLPLPDISIGLFSDDPVENSPSPVSSQTLCPVCNTGVNTLWIGCDYCDYWVHYECAGDEQAAIDMSLMIEEVLWRCNNCKPEE